MKATLSWLGAVLVAVLAVPTARAQYFGPCIPQAPDCCGPGFYATNCCGQWFGPNYCLYPPYPPFNGFVFGPRSGGPGGAGMPGGGPGGPGVLGSPNFPTHPYARSPRDFFMEGTENPYAVSSSYGFSTAPTAQTYAPPAYVPPQSPALPPPPLPR